MFGLECEGIPYGPSMGAINGINSDQIKNRLESVLASPAALANLGSITSRYNEGNGGTTYFHDATSGETLNSMGLPSRGIDLLEPLIAQYSRKFAEMGKLLIVGATTLRGEDATKVLPELIERIFQAGAPVVEANYSCPNIVTAGGGRKPILGYDLDAIYETRSAIVSRVGKYEPVQEKLPPYIGEYAVMIPEIAASYKPERRLGQIGVTGFNTVPNVILERDGEPVLRVEAEVDGEIVVTHAGGLSGSVVAKDYTELQTEFLKHLPEDVPFITTGGIWSGQDVKSRMNDRRVLAATSVTRFWEGEHAGRSYGRVATEVAEEYSEVA